MKRKIVYATFFVVGMSAFLSVRVQNSKMSDVLNVSLANIEALADCELRDGQLADGYCRKDDYNHCFCGSSHWFYSDNCVQQK